MKLENKTNKERRKKKYSKLNERMSVILSRLYSGEVLSMKELVEEFEINLRTIQRDVNERLIHFPIKKNGDKFSLDWVKSENLSSDEDEIAVLQILQEMSKNQGDKFYQKANKVLSKIKLTQINPFYTKIDLEDISDKLQYTIKMEKAIKNRNLLKIKYKIKEPYETIIKPLKIVNFEGFWYLLALDNSKIKKYLLRNILDISILDEKFKVTKKIEKSLENAINIWFDIENEPFTVELFIDGSIAKYFQVKPISKSQVITSKDADGSITILLTITHYMEISSLIKYWLPKIRVLSPKWLDDKIKEDIKKYLGGC